MAAFSTSLMKVDLIIDGMKSVTNIAYFVTYFYKFLRID